MTYRTNDGKFFDAVSEEDLVRQLREDSFTPSTDAEDFMRQCRDRGAKLDKTIRYRDPVKFVADMITAGELTLVN